MVALLKDVCCDFTQSGRDRLRDWKSFRSKLSNLKEYDQIQQVVEYWSKAPLSSFSYDLTCPDTWGTAWEMIDENRWCRQSIAIAMEFTLRLAGWNADRLQLQLIDNGNELRMILVIDKRITCNFTYKQIEIYPNNLNILDSFSYTDKYISV